jgi:hypothetical protein
MIRSHTFECPLHIDWERCEIMGEGRRRLLVIEDDPETAEQLVDFLSTRSGFEPLAVDDLDSSTNGSALPGAAAVISATCSTTGPSRLGSATA